MISPPLAPERPRTRPAPRTRLRARALLDETWPGTFPGAPLLLLAGADEDDGPEPHICRGID